MQYVFLADNRFPNGEIKIYSIVFREIEKQYEPGKDRSFVEVNIIFVVREQFEICKPAPAFFANVLVYFFDR